MNLFQNALGITFKIYLGHLRSKICGTIILIESYMLISNLSLKYIEQEKYLNIRSGNISALSLYE